MQGKGKQLSEIILTATNILLQRVFPRFDLKVMLLTQKMEVQFPTSAEKLHDFH